MTYLYIAKAGHCNNNTSNKPSIPLQLLITSSSPIHTLLLCHNCNPSGLSPATPSILEIEEKPAASSDSPSRRLSKTVPRLILASIGEKI